MATALYVQVGPVKAFAKIAAKRLAKKLMPMQQVLCRASGCFDLGEVYALQANGGIDERVEGLDFATWQHRLVAALGPDLDVLFEELELQTWFARIHGTSPPEDDEVDSDW